MQFEPELEWVIPTVQAKVQNNQLADAQERAVVSGHPAGTGEGQVG